MTEFHLHVLHTFLMSSLRIILRTRTSPDLAADLGVAQEALAAAEERIDMYEQRVSGTAT